MTRTTNAIAGFTFLVYIAATIASMVLFARATGEEEVAGQLAAVARHATDVRLTIVLGLLETSFTASALFFALGSTLFSWLLLRGRMIPVALAWFGVLASALPVVCFPLQLVGLLGGPVTSFTWYPILLFEVALALWLIVKGVVAPPPRQPTHS